MRPGLRTAWLPGLVLLGSCSTLPGPQMPWEAAERPDAGDRQVLLVPLPAAPLIEATPPLWQRLAEHRVLAGCEAPDVERWVRILGSSRERLDAELDRIAPWLGYVWEEAQLRGLPAEAALLPMVESGYRQRRGAGPAGWWQMIPATARTFGLRVDRQVDERMHPVKATRAGLDYLQQLMSRYDGNFVLAAVAYNRGPRHVDRVLRKRRLDPARVDLDTPLDSPAVTRQHMARLAAYGCLIAERAGGPARETDEALEAMTWPVPLPLTALSGLLGEAYPDWQAQHPAYVRLGLVPSGEAFLAPHGFAGELARLGDLTRFPVIAAAEPGSGDDEPVIRQAGHRVHTVVQGDNLWSLARRYGTRVRTLLAANPGLSATSVLKLGQKIRVPE